MIALTPTQLRAWRQERQLLQREAAAWYGCSTSTWKRYENGRRPIPQPLVLRLLAAYPLSMPLSTAKRIAGIFAISLGFLWLLGALLDQPWFYAGLGVATPSTAMALILFSIVIPVFTFPFQPLGAMISRQHEFEADAFAAQYTPAPDLIAALVKLYKDNASTLTPDPLHSVFYDSHPPAMTRIARLQQAAGTH